MAQPIVLIPVRHFGVKLQAGDAMEKDYLKVAGYEPASLAVWAEACFDGKAHTAIDVGAHGGLFAIAANLLGNHAVAVEPSKWLAERIVQNANLNMAIVDVFCLAASNYDGAGLFHTNGSQDSPLSSLTRDPKIHRQSKKVKVRKIDSLPFRGKVGAIKIDVECHEAEALEGALRIIERDRPILIIETFKSEGRKKRIRDMLPNYREAGFLDGRNMYMVPR